MRRACLAILVLLVLGCDTPESLPLATGLPQPVVSLEESVVQRDLVLLVWLVRDGAGRKFEILRRNRAEPWKHFSTVVPVDGRIRMEDTAIVPGQPYTYRLRIFGVTNDSYLDEVQVTVPL